MATEKRLVDANALAASIRRKFYWMAEAVINTIETTPTVDAVEVVHAQWITSDYNMDCECSACGGTFEWWEADEVHYCPQCGAKMDGGGKTDAK